MKNNVANIHIAVEKYLPSVFRAKQAWILFKDPSDPELVYAITSIGEDSNGVKFIRNYVRYPIWLGYTGKWIETKKVLVYNRDVKPDENDIEADIDFSTDIDNYVSETNVRTALYAPIMDKDDVVQGAIQLVNKVNDYETFRY